MKTQTSVNYIEFTCKNIMDIKAFYSKVFGWTFTDYGPDYAAFNDARIDGGFYYSTEHIPAANPLVILYTEQLEKVLTEVKAAGGTIIKEIFSFPGGRRFHFSDPDGNVLAVWCE